MSCQLQVHVASSLRALFGGWRTYKCLLILSTAVLSGCAVPSPEWVVAPADPQWSGPPIHAADVTAGTQTFRPMEPRGWGNMPPQEKKGGSGGGHE
jgi:hypothetical protein